MPDGRWRGKARTATLQLAIVGRPNVGKSTLINRLIGDERLITGPEAGITRDAIAVAWEHAGRPIRLIDTAGMRRRARIDDALEGLSVEDALRTIRFAKVVALVVDATEGLEKQDLTIARMIGEEGRAPLLIANKADLVADPAAVRRRLGERIETSLPQLRGLATVLLSAKTGRHVERFLPAAFAVYDIWNRQVRNRAAKPMADRHARAQPAPDGRRPAASHPLRHPDEGEAADLPLLRQPPRRAAGLLPALSGRRIARCLRACRRAAAPRLSQDPQPLRRQPRLNHPPRIERPRTGSVSG